MRAGSVDVPPEPCGTWEIDQITQHNLQTRLTVVLPPVRLYKDDYPRAFLDACVIMAALEGFAGSIDEVDSFLVHQLEMVLHEREMLHHKSHAGAG